MNHPPLPLLLSCVVFFTALGSHAAPKITADNPEYLFGPVPVGTKVEHIFVLKNEGDETLVINEVKAACGCTSTVLGDKEVPPGGTTEIKSVLDMTMRRGPQVKTISVKSNDPVTPDLQLKFAGEGIDDWDISPTVMSLNQLATGVEHVREVSIKIREGTGHKIKRIRATRELVRAELVEIVPDREYKIIVTIPAQAQPKALHESIMIETTDKSSPVLYCQVAASFSAGLTWAPVQITLPKPSGQKHTMFLTLRPGTIKSFNVIGVEWENSGVEFTALPPTRFGTQVRLRNIDVKQELDKSTVIVKTDAPGFETIRIPVVVQQ